jgi:hypothetical protein
MTVAPQLGHACFGDEPPSLGNALIHVCLRSRTMISQPLEQKE